MFGENFPGSDYFTLSLLANKNVLEVLNKSTNNKRLFTDTDKAAWIADEPGTGAKYLAVFNKASQEIAAGEKAIWKSSLGNCETSGRSKAVNIFIRGI